MNTNSSNQGGSSLIECLLICLTFICFFQGARLLHNKLLDRHQAIEDYRNEEFFRQK